MWVTEVIFNGADKNTTRTIDTSTSEVFAMFKYNRELDRWLRILLGDQFSPLIDIIIKFDKDDPDFMVKRTRIKLDLLNWVLTEQNKYQNKNCSFEISVKEIL